MLTVVEEKKKGALAQWQRIGLLIRWFRVRISGAPQHVKEK